MKTKDMVLMGMLGTTLLVAQIALAFIPNIELVSFLIIIYSLKYGRKTLFSIYVFAILEGLIYGFGLWWVMYLYVWTILCFLTILFKKNTSPLFWAVLSGLFGLFFGALCSIPYFFIGGAALGVSFWITGIPFDILHCAGNFITALVLYKPVHQVVVKIK